MEKIICAVNMLLKEADRVLMEYGLIMEKEVLSMVKSASALIWNNANPITEEYLAYWITDIEYSFVERITEMHKEQIQLYLSE